jgi:ABC-2 type transport system permease protein
VTNAIRSELLKIRTLNGGWLTALGLVGVTLLALCFWYLVERGAQSTTLSDNAPALTQGVFTSGQYFGLLLTMLFGVTLVTSEYTQQTATATFLATPRRSRVVLAKIVAGLCAAFVFFLVTTVVAVVLGSALLSSLGVPLSAGASTGFEAVGLNAIAYLVWVVFGIGLGTLIRNQIAAIVVAIVLYLGELASIALFAELADALHHDWINRLVYFLPGGASRAMTAIVPANGSPPWWAATFVLLGYGVVATFVGAFIIRSRDIT